MLKSGRKKQERWEGHEQALIKTIQKETKRTEELEEAGQGSPTWAVLRALQQINSATRIKGEAAMSAPPFFQSAGREDLLFLGGKGTNGNNMGEPIRTRKENWPPEASTMPNWVVWYKSKKGRKKSAYLSSAGKRSSLAIAMMKRNRKRRRTKRTGAKRMHITGRACDTGHGGSKATSKWQ